jgi:hypothetical protein
LKYSRKKIISARDATKTDQKKTFRTQEANAIFYGLICRVTGGRHDFRHVVIEPNPALSELRWFDLTHFYPGAISPMLQP